MRFPKNLVSPKSNLQRYFTQITLSIVSTDNIRPNQLKTESSELWWAIDHHNSRVEDPFQKYK